MQATVSIKLFATLAGYTPDQHEQYPIASGMLLAELLVELGIPQDEVKIAFVNSRKVTFDTPLKDGDRIGVFPAVGGG